MTGPAIAEPVQGVKPPLFDQFMAVKRNALFRKIDRHFAHMGEGAVNPARIPVDEMSVRRWKNSRLAHERRPNGVCERHCARCQLDRFFPAGPPQE
jgi:hypothetical protein